MNTAFGSVDERKEDVVGESKKVKRQEGEGGE